MGARSRVAPARAAGETFAISVHSPRAAYVAIALGVLAIVAYANSFDAALVLDSRSIIERDPRVHTWNGDTLSFIFTRNYWWPEHTSDLYRPLTTLSYWANATLAGAGTDVTGYHVVNLVLHWANALLVFALLVRLGAPRDVAVVAAAIFTVHPVMTEAVTNVVGRADLLATLAVLASSWCYVRAHDERAHARGRWLAAAGAVALLGVFAKETAVVIGGFVVLYDAVWRWPRARGESLRARITDARRAGIGRDYLAFVPAASAFVIVRLVFRAQGGPLGESFVTNPIATADTFPALLTAWNVIAHAFGLVVFPLTLSPDYSYNQIPLVDASAGVSAYAAGIAALVVSGALVWFALRTRRENPARAWSVLFFFAALLPTSNLLVPIGSIFGERFLYLPMVGAAGAGAFGLAAVTARIASARGATSARGLMWIVAGVGVLALGARTVARNGDWRDDVTFWQRAVATSPNSFNTHAGYAAALLLRTQDEPTIDSAIAHAEVSQRILESPPAIHERQTHTVLLSLGVYHRLKSQRAGARGDTAQARQSLAASLGALMRAREIDVRFNAAQREAYAARGRSPDAIADAGDYTLYLELGNTLLEARAWRDAQDAARYAQRLMPDAAQAHLIEGVALFYARHPDSAAVAIASALLIDPRQREHWDNLASCFQAMGLAPPIVESNGHAAFDMRSALTPQLLLPAAQRVVARYDDAKRPEDGARWRDRFARDYDVRW